LDATAETRAALYAHVLSLTQTHQVKKAK